MLSARPWKLEAVVTLLLGIFVSICSLSLAVGLVERFTGARLSQNPQLSMALGILVLDGSILLMVFLFLRLQGISWTEAFGFKMPRVGRSVLLGVLAAMIFLPVGLSLKEISLVVLARLHFTAHEQAAVQALKEASPGLGRACLAFFAVALAPVAEETLFRGILYPTIKQCGYPKTALWGTSLVFALIHLDPSAFVSLTIFALVLTFLYERTGNLLACIAAHSAFNAVNVVFLYWGDFLKHAPGPG